MLWAKYAFPRRMSPFCGISFVKRSDEFPKRPDVFSQNI